ncbi:MAG TPA: DMT family transporter [Anaerolineales bacterium]|nr:DMT family transporter [Anaerolineales bacterium]
MSTSASPLPAAAFGARWLGVALCALSAAGFASLSILGKFAFAEGLSLPGMLSLRFGGAALILVAFFALRDRRLLFPGARLCLALLALGAIGYAGQSTLYFIGLRRLPASLSSLLLYVYPAFVALLNWAVYRQPVARREWGALALAFLGVTLTVDPVNAFALQTGAFDILGAACVLGSAVWYAGYIVGSAWVVRRVAPMVSTAWICAGAALTFTVGGLAVGDLRWSLSPEGWAIVAGMILISTILAVGTFLAGVARLGPTVASLLSTLEPVFTVALAGLLLGERLAPAQTAGGGMVLAAVILLNLRKAPDHST